MNRVLAPPAPVRTKSAVADAALIAAFAYPTALTALGEYAEWSVQTRAVALLVSAIFLTLPLLFSQRMAGARPLGYAAVFSLALFLLMSAFSSLNAESNQLRYDGDAMWRQLAMAMFPALLFWGGRTWGARQFSVIILDRATTGVLAFCAASILFELAGITGYDYGFRRFGYLGDSIAWVFSFLAAYNMIRGRPVLFVISLAFLLLTVSIGAFFIFVAAVLAYLFVSRLSDTRSLAIRVIVVLVGIVFLFFAQGLVAQLLDRVSGVDLLQNDRIRTIEFSLGVFSDNPVFGAGYNAHTYFFNRTVFNIDMTRPFWSTPVSTWAQVLADSGMVGFIPFVAWVVACCRICLRALRLDRHDAEGRALMGMAAWLLAFLPLNQSAAWLLPSSILSPLVFLVGGIVVGRMSQLGRSPSRATAPRPGRLSPRDRVPVGR